MPRKPVNHFSELSHLIAEQEKDRQNKFVYPERITPRKLGRPSCITQSEYTQLILELGNLTREQIAKEMHVTPACIRQRRWNAHKKLGAGFKVKWKTICKAFKAYHLSVFPSLDNPPPSRPKGRKIPLRP